MATEDTYLTREGEDALRRELKQLVETRRPALARKLKDAVAQGDLKENADYHDAKEQLGLVEGRVQHIESVLMNATIVDSAGANDEVRVGSVVVIQEVGTDENEEYRIVGSAEANPRERKISQKSPIGSALLGKPVGPKSLSEHTRRRNKVQDCRNPLAIAGRSTARVACSLRIGHEVARSTEGIILFIFGAFRRLHSTLGPGRGRAHAAAGWGAMATSFPRARQIASPRTR